MKKNIIMALTILVVGIVVGLLCRPKGCSHTTIVQRDTTIVHDTIRIDRPVVVTKVRKDTILVHVTDTVRIKDSVYIALPMETKTYKGDDYLARVSGYNPSLDYIEIYAKTQFVTEVQKQIVRQKNFFSIGTEVVYTDGLHNYIYAEYERMLHQNVCFSVRALHDIPTKCNGVSVGIKARLGW